MAGLVAWSCATPDAILQVSAPASVVAGSPCTVTVTATASGRVDTIFNSPIRLTSSDSAAILPVVYTFTAADAGSHTFTNAVTLMTPGSQSITATDPNAHSITGTANVAVTATPADRTRLSRSDPRGRKVFELTARQQKLTKRMRYSEDGTAFF